MLFSNSQRFCTLNLTSRSKSRELSYRKFKEVRATAFFSHFCKSCIVYCVYAAHFLEPNRMYWSYNPYTFMHSALYYVIATQVLCLLSKAATQYHEWVSKRPAQELSSVNIPRFCSSCIFASIARRQAC